MRKIPIQQLNTILDRLGIEKTWHSILATHIHKLDRPDLQYILEQNEFKNSQIQDFDIIDSLSIGEISVLYEYSLAYVDSDKRKQEGQYFTPDDVAQLMAKKTLLFPAGKIWADPCSGVGNLSFWLIQLQKDPEKFLTDHIYIIDTDALALFIARTLFTVNFQNKSHHLFFDIQPRFVVADFLLEQNLPKFDFAILNPPYVGVEPDNRFETADARDLYAYFLERVIKLTKGFVSISPQTFTHGQRFRSLRRLMLENLKDISIYCFDNVPDNIFRGVKFGSTNSNKVNSTRAGIIVAKANGNRQSFRITPLLRWRTKERAELLSRVDEFLVSIEPNFDIFPKLQENLLPLYREAKNIKRYLAHLTAQSATHYKLIIPSTPRYFISALKTEVARSSFRTLYFYTKEERDLAYLLLNSSYMYWWWRINDGGMTISERTLLSLPIPENIFLDPKLIAQLEYSETTNRVVKRNAGKDNENVKHDPSLVKEINKKIFPRFASALDFLHSNSAITI